MGSLVNIERSVEPLLKGEVPLEWDDSPEKQPKPSHKRVRRSLGDARQGWSQCMDGFSTRQQEPRGRQRSKKVLQTDIPASSSSQAHIDDCSSGDDEDLDGIQPFDVTMVTAGSYSLAASSESGEIEDPHTQPEPPKQRDRRKAPPAPNFLPTQIKKFLEPTHDKDPKIECESPVDSAKSGTQIKGSKKVLFPKQLCKQDTLPNETRKPQKPGKCRKQNNLDEGQPKVEECTQKKNVPREENSRQKLCGFPEDLSFSKQQSLSAELPISGYDSDPEPEGSDECQVQRSRSPVISTETPPVSPCDQGKVSKNKGSDWVNTVQLRPATPEKNEAYSGGQAPEDSGKKKKPKYKKGGLADRLHRLISREKSAVAFWQHKLGHGQVNSDPSKCLSVRVVSVCEEWSLLLAECRQTDGQPLLVLFNKLQAQQLQLQQGSDIKIHPPWQKLNLGSRGDVILCPQYTQLLGQSSRSETEVTEHTTKVITARWQCPCMRDATLVPSDCPACTNARVVMTKVKLDPSVLPSTSCPSHLSKVESPESARSQGSPLSILDSVERRGGFSAEGVSFQAVVQRITCRHDNRQSKNIGTLRSQVTANGETKPRWSILVEDIYGCFCEVLLPEECEAHDPWRSLLRQGQGQVWSFQGLRVQQRLHRIRSPGLFCLIDSLWQPEVIQVKGQNSQGSQDSQPGPPPVPGFCYSLVALYGEAECSPVSTKGRSPLYRPPDLLPLTTATEDGDGTRRLSFTAKLIHCVEEPSTKSHHLFLADVSTQQQLVRDTFTKGHVRLHLQPGQPAHNPQLHQQLRQGQLLACWDACVEQGRLFLDVYSTMMLLNEGMDLPGLPHIPQEQLSSLQQLSPRLPQLQQLLNLQLHDLIMVRGVIAGVDEAAAYTWLACQFCDSDKLIGGDALNPFLSCQNCGRSVSSPKTKIRLEVFLKSIVNLPQVQIRVKLLQSTIESILPEEGDEEGYDLSCVLGHKIGPIACHVEDLTRNPVLGTTDAALREFSL